MNEDQALQGMTGLTEQLRELTLQLLEHLPQRPQLQRWSADYLTVSGQLSAVEAELEIVQVSLHHAQKQLDAFVRRAS